MIYFSIGESLAFLAIAVAIPQLAHPVYLFRLYNLFFGLTFLYSLMTLSTLMILLSAILSNYPSIHGSTVSFWLQFVAGLTGLLVFLGLSVAFLYPARVRRGGVGRFVASGIRLIAQANDRDRSQMCLDVLSNMPRLFRYASFLEFLPRETSPFFDYINRKAIQNAQYAHAFIRAAGDDELCATIVAEAPWDAAKMLNNLSEETVGYGHRSYGASQQFIQNLARQAIYSERSILLKENGYSSLSVAPALSDALFRNTHIRRVYEPLNFLDLGYLDDRPISVTEKLLVAISCQVENAISSKDFWRYRTLGNASDMIAWSVRNDRSADTADFRRASAIGTGLTDLINVYARGVARVKPGEFSSLFAGERGRSFTLIGELANLFCEFLLATSNDFQFTEDKYWSAAQSVLSDLFPKHPTNEVGIEPLQQHILILLDRALENNARSFYPPVSRTLLACIGAYDNGPPPHPRSAAYALRALLYGRMKDIVKIKPRMHASLENFLPPNVVYDRETNSLLHQYSGGSVSITNLSRIRPKRVDLVSGIEKWQPSNQRSRGENLAYPIGW